MVLPNLNIASKGKKRCRQEVQGVIVNKNNGEFIFNYNTSKDPVPEELEVLRVFRNHFVDELVKLNKVLGHCPV